MTNIVQNLTNFNILHGRSVVYEVMDKVDLKNRFVQVNENICILTVIDKQSLGQSTLHNVNITNNKINFLLIDKYEFWTSKIKELINYIKNNYNNLPNYILYLDALDTLILNDINHPSEYLDFYKSKILFNTEPAYWSTGYQAPIIGYLDSYSYDNKEKYKALNKEKYGTDFEIPINAGVFLGEKEYTLSLLEETYDIMTDDINKGFPYGCIDDQLVLRYLHTKHFEHISGDIFNTFSFWGCIQTFENPENIFRLDYTKQFLNNYKL
jgi:hypothetical protein